jgi:signal transduction histidine kinase
MILSEARRLADVVEGFLRFARPFPVKPEEVDLVALSMAFCREQSRLFPQSPVECALPSAPLRARTDPEALRQILLNLVQNARRHQVPGAPVRIGLAGGEGARREFRVEDDGPGVAIELRANLFEPYRTSSPGGHGLGLALSRRIARALGGDLTYQPLSAGSRFILTIPVGEAPRS